MMKATRWIAVFGTALFACQARAHIVFDQPQATVGKSFIATLRVTHGCEGSPTTKVSVTIPAGFIGVKPQAKAGWRIETVKGPYDHPYETMHGALAEGVKTITWSDGSLPADFTDEFKFTGLVDKSLAPNTALYFPVVQTCAQGEQRWTDTDAAAASHTPAPALRLVAAAEKGTADKGATSGPITIDSPWSRATPGGAKVAAGYLTIVNSGPSGDRLVSVTSDISDRGEIHEMAVKDGVMTMRPIDGGVPVAAGASLTLKPGSYHLMFQDLKRPLKQGERFDATLTFEKAGPLKATFDVQGIGATAPAAEKSGTMPSMDMHMKH